MPPLIPEHEQNVNHAAPEGPVDTSTPYRERVEEEEGKGIRASGAYKPVGYGLQEKKG